MGNKTTVEVTEQTLYNIDILEDETTTVEITIPQDIVTVEVSQFTIDVNIYNSLATADGQPFYSKSGADFTLKSFVDDDKTIDISEPGGDRIEVKLPDSGIRVQDGFVISTDSDDSANITFTGSGITIDGVQDMNVSGNLTVGNATITNATVTTATITTGDITTVNATDVNTTDATLTGTLVAPTGNITTINATDVNITDDLSVTDDASIGGDLTVTGNVTAHDGTFSGTVAITENTTIGGNVTVTGNVTAHDGTFSGTVAVTENITGDDIDTNTGTIDVLNVTTAEASDEFIGDLRGAVRFRAQAGEALSKGDVVYVSGISGNTPVVNKADASDSAKMPAYGLAFEDANNNASLEITTFGALAGIDTSAFSLGTIYVSTTAGELTQTKPTDPTHLIQNIGRVKRVHASNGSIIVGGAGRTNDVPNTFSIQGDITTAANISANNITLTNDVTADDVTTANLSVTDTATIATGDITTVNATTLNATNATLTGDIDAATGTIDTLDGVTVTYTTGNLTTVNATTVNTTDATLTGTLVAPTGNITTVNATNINGTDLALTGDISAVVDITTSGDVVIGGDLTVSGTTTTINTETLELADNNIVLNSNHTGSPTQDAGITVERGSSDDAVFQWNETDDKFEVLVGTSLATLKAADVETTNLTATLATVTTGNITTVNSTTITGTTINATDLNVSDDLVVTDDASVGGNLTVTGDHDVTGNIDVTGDLTISGALVGLDQIDNINKLRIGVENPSTVDGDGIVLWDKTTAWALENKLSTANNADDVVHDGGTAPIGDIVYITNDSIEMSANIVATGQTNGTVIQSGSIKFENSGIGQNSILDGRKLNVLEVQTNALNNMSGTGDITLKDNLVPETDGSLDLGSDSTRFDNIYTDDMYVTDGLTVNSITARNVSTNDITVTADLVPSANVTYSLGNNSNYWHSAFIGPGSLYIDGQKVLGSDETGNIDITTDDDQNLNISAGGAGTVGDITISSAGSTTTLNDNTVNLGPAANTATVNVRGTLDVNDHIEIDDLDIYPDRIVNGAINGSLEIRTDGTGYLHANVADVYVGTLTNATKIDENSIEVIGGDTLTVKDKLKVDTVVQVDDGFTMTSFNPYSGFGGTAMPTTFAGVGNEDGWASLHIRNRGEHDFGIGSQYNFSPRAILGLSAGRKDSGSDDYLDSGDKFGSVQFLPYSGYKTGTEWLTNSAEIAGVATENHSSTGLGTKLVFRTTTDGAEASASEASHTDAEITMQGTTISSDGDLKFDDDVVITGTTEFQGNLSSNGSVINVDDNLKTLGSNNNSVLMGDQQIGGTYDISAIKVIADENRWASLTLQEYVGGANKPFASGFANPTFGTEIIGGTYASPAAVASGKRLFMLQALAANQSDGTLPSTSNFRIKAETTEAQTTSARGTNLEIDTTPDGATSTTTSLRIQGSTVVVHPDGDGTLTTGGDLIIDDDLVVNNTLHVKTTSDFDGNVNMDGNLQVDGTLDVDGNATFDGNVTLGNGNTDVITSTGKLVTQNGLTLTNLPYNTLVYLDGLGIVDTGGVAFITDGARANRPVYYDGSDWRYMSDDAVIST